MDDALFDYVKTLTARDKKSLSQKALKTSEECGEMAKAVLPYDNAGATTHRFIEKQKILEECADVMLCSLSIAYDLGFTTEQLFAMMMSKANKWDVLQQQELKVAETLPFEIHVTIGAGESGINLDAFKSTCNDLGVKPLLIDMHGQSGETVMLDAQTSSVFTGTNRTVLDEVERINDGLRAAGFNPVRSKVETVPWHPAAPSELNQSDMPKDCYFEAHIPIVVSEERQSALVDFMKNRRTHLSRNAFKKRDGGTSVIMGTLRNHSGTREQFERDLAQEVDAINKDGWLTEPYVTEFSIYDTKVHHDSSWLTSV